MREAWARVTQPCPGTVYAQADATKVKDLVNRLDNFDGPAVAEKAIEYGLYEEAFDIYKKFNMKVDAAKVR